MADLGISGLATNFDWRAFVDQLVEIERAPQQRLRNEQSLLGQRNNAFASITTQLSVLNNRVDALKDPALYSARLATSSDVTLGTASATSAAAVGTTQFEILQLATVAKRLGTINVGRGLSETADVSNLALSAAPLALAVTAGTFTVNGQSISVATTDSLQSIFERINAATGGTVTGSYNPVADKASLTSASEVVLGNAADTSNFLQAFGLFNNGTETISSRSTLAGVKTNLSLAEANLAVTINDNAGTGAFRVNGVNISYKATESLDTVLSRINNSAANVTASYDSVADRFVLTDKTTGDVGINVEEVSGNFLAATGLLASTLERGQNLRYTVNNGGERVSYANTITEQESGITGLSVTPVKEGIFTVTVSSDTSKIKTALTDFLEDYNRVQAIIDTNTASSVDADGKVTAGLLAGDRGAGEIASRLRAAVVATVGGASSTLTRLEGLGINSNGQNDNLALTDSAKLDAVLAGNIEGLKTLFSDETAGLAMQLSSYLKKTIGDEGSLVSHQNNLTLQATGIDVQIADQERIVQSNRERLLSSFIAMEQAQARINQQMAFLSQKMGIA